MRLAGSHFLEAPNQASTISYLTPPAENAGLYKACRFKGRRDARFFHMENEPMDMDNNHGFLTGNDLLLWDISGMV